MFDYFPNRFWNMISFHMFRKTRSLATWPALNKLPLDWQPNPTLPLPLAMYNEFTFVSSRRSLTDYRLPLTRRATKADMRAGTRQILAVGIIFDAAHRAIPHERDHQLTNCLPFTIARKWALDNFDKPEVQQVVSLLMETLERKGSKKGLGEEESDDDVSQDLRAKFAACLKKPFVTTLYRVVRSLKGPRNSLDSRPWQFFEMALTTEDHLPFEVVRSQFVLSGAPSQTRKRKTRGAGPFSCRVPPSRFQLVLYMSLARSVSDGRRGKAEDWLERVGFAVQVVVEVWDAFAKRLTYRNTEEMLIPYLRFDCGTLQYRALRQTEKGVVDGRTERLTLQGSDTDVVAPEEAVEKENEGLDCVLRHLAGRFIRDLKMFACSPELFGLTLPSDWEEFEKFRRTTPNELASTLYILRADIVVLVKGLLEKAEDSLKETERGGEGARKMNGLDVGEGEDDDTDDDDDDEEKEAPERARNSTLQPNPICEGDECHCLTAKRELEDAMSPYVRLYNCSFEELLDTDETTYSASKMENRVQLLLTDPPLSMRRQRERGKSGHDHITREEMKIAALKAEEQVRPGGHVIVFCSMEQYHVWERNFRVLVDEEKEPVFSVDPMPLSFVRRPGYDSSYPFKFRKTCRLYNLAEHALHATRKGAGGMALEMVTYKPFNYVPSRHPGWGNVFDNVPPLESGEALLQMEKKSNGVEKAKKVRPGQKSEKLMRELVARFSLPGDLVVDMFGGTFTTAIACLTMPVGEHRIFVGCELEEKCFFAGRLRVLEAFARALTDTKGSKFVVSAEALDAARVVVQHAKVRKAPSMEWCAPPKFPQYSELPSCVVRFLANLWREPDLTSALQHKCVDDWPREYQGRLNSMDPNILLSVEATAAHVFVAKSTIRHPSAGEGLFTGRRFQAMETVGGYYGLLVYENLSERETKAKTYGGGILSATAERFRTSSFGMKTRHGGYFTRNASSRKGEGSKGHEIHIPMVYVVPAPFCVTSKINDPRYAETDLDVGQKDSSSCRSANVEFVLRKGHVARRRDLTNCVAISVRTKWEIAEGEELFLDYGREHCID